MKSIFSILRLVLHAFFCALTGRVRRPPVQPVPQPSAPVPPVKGRYTLRDGVYTNGKSDTKAVVLLTGDLLCQRRQQNACRAGDGYDFRCHFSEIQPLLHSADLVVGNLETILAEGFPYMAQAPVADGLPYLNAPPQWLDALREAGFDALVNANNHCCDAGPAGITQTLAALDGRGFPHTGLFRDERERRFLLLDVNGIRIAVLAYTTAFNFKSCYVSRREQKTTLNRYSAKKAAADMAAAKRDGAEFIITYMHWGVEYTRFVTPGQKRIARRLARLGSGCIAGTHPHVVQRLQTVGGVPCVYSMGNFISSQTRPGTRDSVVLRLTLEKEDGHIALTDCTPLPCRTVGDPDTRDCRVQC